MKFLLMIFLLIPSLARAQEEDSNTVAAPEAPTTPSEVTTTPSTKRKSTKLFQAGPRFMIWQEKIDGTESGTPLIYNARFTAVAGSLSYKASWGDSARWLYAHEADLIIGSVKASGTVNQTTDNLNSLLFVGLQLSPGIAYRTNNATMIIFSAPLFYRKCSWDIGRDTLQLGKESLFDFGLGVTSSWRLGNGTFFNAGVTARQHSSLWTIGMDLRL